MARRARVGRRFGVNVRVAADAARTWDRSTHARSDHRSGRIHRVAPWPSGWSPKAGGSPGSTPSPRTTTARDKAANLAGLQSEPRFDLVRADVATAALDRLLADRPVVVHLAAQPGVRGSFGTGFDHYVHDNILGTQRVLEAALEAGCPRVVYASSSSVYGDAAGYPCLESRHADPAAVAVRGDQADLREARRGLPRARDLTRSGCATSPSTVRGSAPTWRSAGSARRPRAAASSPCTATAPSPGTSPTSTTRWTPPSAR